MGTNEQSLELIKIRKKLNRLHDKHLTWRAVASMCGYSLPVMTIWRIATDETYEPKRKDIRMKLGLTPMKQVPTCTCGEVHTRATCPDAPRKRAKTAKVSTNIPWELNDIINDLCSVFGCTRADFVREAISIRIEMMSDGRYIEVEND